MKERELGRRGRRWNDSIKICLKEIDWEAVHSIHVAWVGEKLLAFANTVMNLRGFIKMRGIYWLA
jgi:hypothetical protein